ncbi:MAG: hypothetical protein JSS98_10580 [Bacteroidetes bacterium]|nr:hypothetical protein [Bacteroidota bacterium]
MKLEDLNLKQLKQVVKHYNLNINCSKLNKKELIKQILKVMEYKNPKNVRGGDMTQADKDDWQKLYQAGFDNAKAHPYELSIVQNVPRSKYTDITSPQNEYYYDPYVLGQNDALKQIPLPASNLPDSIKNKWQQDYNAGVAYANNTLGTDAKTIQEAPYMDYKQSGIHANWNGKSPDIDDSQKYYFEPKSFGYNAQLTALKKNYNYHPGNSAWESFKTGFEMPFKALASIF